MRKKKAETRNKLALALIALLWFAPLAVAASEFPGMIRLEMDPQPAELKLFQGYLEALEHTSGHALRVLAQGGRDILDAVEAQDYEAYLAAKAVYAYRLETLDDSALATMRKVANEALKAQPAPERKPMTPVERVNVNYGCGAELTCDDGTTISCTCANGQPFNAQASSCVYKPNFNPWGGRVICDCSGTRFDSTRTCSYIPPTSCSPGCVNECGLIGGVCLNGNCFCN